MVPVWFLDRHPSGDEILVYCTLARHGTWNPGTATYDECRPAMATMVGEARISESSIRRALKGLREKNAIESHPRFREDGSQLPTVYRVIFGSVIAPDQTLSPVTPPGSTGDSPPPVIDDTPGVPPVTDNLEPNTENPNTQKNSSSATADQEGTERDETDPRKSQVLQMAQQLCDHLADLMVGNGCKRPTVTKKWLDDARLMITNDEREPREAWKLIGWCQRDPFWSGNIHSMTKFRAQYDKLRQRANGAVVAAGPPRQEFKSAAEKKREQDEHETQRYRIADKLAEQRGIRITQLPWGSPEREAFWAEVDQIHQEMLHTRRQSGYTNGEVIDAEVIQPTVPEVTA